MSKVSASQIKDTPTEAVHDNKVAEVDQVLKDIADYVHDYKIESPLAACYPLPCWTSIGEDS